MKISAFKMILAVTPLIISSCTSFRDARFDESMKDLRSQVSEGDNIYAAKKKIEGRYDYLSDIHDPTGLGDYLLMDVSFGLLPTDLETFAYAADVRLPFNKNKGLGAVIKSDASGTIQEIK